MTYVVGVLPIHLFSDYTNFVTPKICTSNSVASGFRRTFCNYLYTLKRMVFVLGGGGVIKGECIGRLRFAYFSM